MGFLMGTIIGGTTVQPTVSIITPAYNCERYITETIQSVLHQSLQDWEHLIIDDGSTDRTREIVRDLSRADTRIRLIENESNLGAAASRNRGLEAARGRYIAFLDSDDCWMPQKLERQIASMRENKDVFSFTPYQVISEDGRPIRLVDTAAPKRVNFEQMLKKEATLGCSTVMLDKEFVEKTRFPDIKRAQDYGFWLKLLQCGVSAARHDDVMTLYRIQPNGISRNKFKKIGYQWRVYRHVMEIPAHRSLYYMYFYAKNALFRK